MNASSSASSNLISRPPPMLAYTFPLDVPPRTTMIEYTIKRYITTIKSPPKPLEKKSEPPIMTETNTNMPNAINGATINNQCTPSWTMTVSLPRSLKKSLKFWKSGGPTRNWNLADTLRSTQPTSNPRILVKRRPGKTNR